MTVQQATVAGTVQAILTWTPATGLTNQTDPPSSQVIVSETASASFTWGLRLNPTAPPSPYAASDGLGDPAQPTYTNGILSSLTSSGTHWSVKDGSSGSIKLTCVLNAQSPPIQTGNPLASASANYTVLYYPVNLAPTGTNDPTHGDFRALTGQQITGTLSGPGIGKITAYTWSFTPSATVFKTYNENAASNQLVALGPADLTGADTTGNGISVSPIKFYDRKQESLTVNCTISFTAPDGTPLSVSATSPTISVLKPTVTWDIYTGYVQHVQNPSGQRGYQLMPAPGSTHAGGEAWSNAKIVVPAPFTATGGSGCFAQLITPDTEITNDDPAKAPTFINNKQQGLDNSFPYKVYKWDVSGPGANFDGPGLFYENYNSSGYAGWSKASETDAFTTWVMYQPPGGVWVPLQSYDWNWLFTSLWSNSQDQWILFRARPATAADDPHYQGSDTVNPPQWKLVQNNS